MALLEPAAGKASGTGIPDGAALTGAKIYLLKFIVFIILTKQRQMGRWDVDLPLTLYISRTYKKLHCKGKPYRSSDWQHPSKNTDT